jgi:uncharacterized protein (TIGR00266 family)
LAATFDLQGNPDYGDLVVRLDAGDSIFAMSGAMTRMSSHLDVQGRLIGGFFRALLRKLLGRTSLFIAEYRAAQPGMVALSATLPGTVLQRRLDGGSLYLAAGAFLACSPGVHLQARFGGIKAFFSGQGAFFLECSGSGDVFYSAYGGVIEKTVDGSFTVDTGHLLAWEPTLDYHIGGMGGIKQTLFSGEGLVMKFTGKGKIYLQTRNLAGLAGWLAPYCR